MSVIVFGKVEIVEKESEKQKGIEAILDKYSREFREKGMKCIAEFFDEMDEIKFTIEELTAKGK